MPLQKRPKPNSFRYSEIGKIVLARA